MDASLISVGGSAQWQRMPAGTKPAFWQLGLSTGERTLLFAVVAMIGMLHLAPVIHSGLATPLLFLLPAVAYCSPITGFVFISACQYLPFPQAAILNPAQLGVFVWLPVVLVRYGRLNLAGIRHIWPVILLLAWRIVSIGPQDEIQYLKAFVYYLIGLQLAHEARGQYLKCLFGLCLGAVLVTSAYWASKLGLPVEISDWGGVREGFTRMGGVRADSVMVWPPILIGVSGVLGIVLAISSRECQVKPPNWFKPLGISLFIVSLPPLVSTMCHGAFAGFVCVVFAFGVAFYRSVGARAFSSRTVRKLVAWMLRIGIVTAVLFAADVFQMRTKAVALWSNYSKQSAKMGAAASRTDVWKAALESTFNHPLVGGLAANDEAKVLQDYSAHNVFLDFGRAGGIPGLLFAALVFFWPLIRVWPAREARFLPFLLVYFAFFVFWMSLPFPTYKSIWGFWALMIVAFPRPAAYDQARPLERHAGLTVRSRGSAN